MDHLSKRTPSPAVSSQSEAALLVMAKRPAATKTKTRLCPPLSPQAAADLYAAFLQDTVERARSLPGLTPLLAVFPPEALAYFRKAFPDLGSVVQRGSSLAGRLEHVLSQALRAGFGRVAAINTDSPTLPAAYLEQAFDRLADPGVDVVLGPCEDGGYYLIGWKQAHSFLIRNVEMSTPRVLADTLELAEARGLCIELLPAWYDIDRPEDLRRLRAELQTDPALAQHTSAALQRLLG